VNLTGMRATVVMSANLQQPPQLVDSQPELLRHVLLANHFTATATAVAQADRNRRTKRGQ
jgi:hypothetical protein